MPNTTAAKKYVKVTKRKYLRNMKVKKSLRDTIKKLNKAIEEKLDEKKIGTLLKDALKSLDKAAQKKTIKKNTAGRRKSRLTKKINKLVKEKK